MSAIYSMTGFAGVRGDGFTVTLKGVNHRFLGLSLRLPPGCDELEMQLRRALKERLRRGHVDVTVQVDRREGQSQALQLNEELLGAYVAAFRRASAVCGVAGELDVNAALRQPGVLRVEATATSFTEDADALAGSVLALLPEVLERFNEARAREGAALAAELRAAMLRVEGLAAEVTELREGVRAAHVERLRGRMAELLAGAVAEERLLAEAALLAERSDIDEELARLRTHTERFRALLDEGGELGKRLDFLLQELNREANTLLSKTGGAAGLRVTELGLAMKLEIERAKEQVQNLE